MIVNMNIFAVRIELLKHYTKRAANKINAPNRSIKQKRISTMKLTY